MKTKIFLSTLILILLFLISPLAKAALPPTIVYKTDINYNNLVPIGLSEDNSMIVSYPDPGDVSHNGKLAYPTKLSQDYLLDNRGIGPNSAFLDITYDKYSQLDKVPSHEEFFSMIKNYDPFLEMYDCGNRYDDETNELNAIINQGKLNDKCVLLLDKSDPTPIKQDKSNDKYVSSLDKSEPTLEAKQSYLIYWIIGIATIVIIISYLILRKKK